MKIINWSNRIDMTEEVANITLNTAMHDHIDENFLIDFWGLNEPDVEWYKLEKINEHKEIQTKLL